MTVKNNDPKEKGRSAVKPKPAPIGGEDEGSTEKEGASGHLHDDQKAFQLPDS